MTLVGEATLDSPILAATLEAVPEATLQLEEIRSLPDERLQFLMWVAECEFHTFEAAVVTDETIQEFRQLTDVGDRRLYRFTLSETGEATSTYLAAAAEDIVVLDLTVTTDGMRVIARIPSREALQAYTEACQQRGVRFQLKRLYEEKEATTPDRDGGEQFGVTEPQREALRCALEMGYFEVPRETSITEIADQLDTSGQALSTLLRRGEKNLLQNTLTER